jgi:hypothetical protein
MNPCVICTKPIDKLYSIWDAGAPIVTHVAFCSTCLAVLKLVAQRHQQMICDVIDCDLPRQINSDRCINHGGARK